MEQDMVDSVVTREVVDCEFGKLLADGGWRPSLMPQYIDNVICYVQNTFGSRNLEYYKLKKAVIKRMKELDPVLFKRDI